MAAFDAPVVIEGETRTLDNKEKRLAQRFSVALGTVVSAAPSTENARE